ncbi:MAG TPA: hypothetical protein VF257_18355 [Solirubrobacteraceae bacterium]
MPQPEPRAWWSDVQHLRDSIERRREAEARRGLRLDARSAARAVADRAASGPAESEGEPRGRFARPGPDDREPRGRFARPGPDEGEPRGRFARPEPDDRAPRRRSARSERDGDEAQRDRGVRAAEGTRRALKAPSRRRTVEITGRTVGAPSLPRLVQIDRRRPARRAVERVGPRPDRLALWAVVLGFFLILVAVTSTSHAATRAPGARAVDGHTAHSQVLRAYTATLRATPPAR